MKKYIALALIAIGCAIVPLSKHSGVIVIDAQTLPMTKVFAWDAVADPCLAADATALACPVLSYTLQVDGVVVGSPTAPQQSVTFTTGGKRTFVWWANNVFGQGATATQVVQINIPAAPKNGKLQ